MAMASLSLNSLLRAGVAGVCTPQNHFPQIECVSMLRVTVVNVSLGCHGKLSACRLLSVLGGCPVFWHASGGQRTI